MTVLLGVLSRDGERSDLARCGVVPARVLFQSPSRDDEHSDARALKADEIRPRGAICERHLLDMP